MNHMADRPFYYLRIWLKTSYFSVKVNFANRGASLMYILGKIIRFFFFMLMLTVVGSQRRLIAGYTIDQVIIFFLVFNIYDIAGQTFFRGIYTIRGEIVSGRFDFRLLRPLNILFQTLTTNTDLLDIPIVAIVFWFLWQQHLSLSLPDLILFLLISTASLTLILAIHIFVAGVGILSTEVDNLVMIFRDVSAMGRIPVDIYTEPVRFFLTFVVPVAVITTFPAKSLIGLLSWQTAIFSILGSGFVLWLSICFWHLALQKYSSASS